MEVLEPKHYIRLVVSRELTNDEFELITDIVDDEIGDLVDSDDVIEHMNEDNMVCYVFELLDDISNSEFGTASGDIISYEIDQVLPLNVSWELESSLPDMEIDIANDASHDQIQESISNHIKKSTHIH